MNDRARKLIERYESKPPKKDDPAMALAKKLVVESARRAKNTKTPEEILNFYRKH